MIDEIDRAQQREHDDRERALDAQRQRSHAALHGCNRDGRCTECDVEIDPRRLAILPGTELCIDCADIKERRRG